jgi:hypothetical protein
MLGSSRVLLWYHRKNDHISRHQGDVQICKKFCLTNLCLKIKANIKDMKEILTKIGIEIITEVFNLIITRSFA